MSEGLVLVELRKSQQGRDTLPTPSQWGQTHFRCIPSPHGAEHHLLCFLARKTLVMVQNNLKVTQLSSLPGWGLILSVASIRPIMVRGTGVSALAGSVEPRAP